MKLVLLGPPGAGKGTQAEYISEEYNIPAISTGAIIRDAIASGTEFGKKAGEIINGGNLLPDDVVCGMIRERISKEDCANGFILDGFPRTVPQAEALEKMNIGKYYVLSLEVPDGTIVERLENRRECSKCHAAYHLVSRPSSKDGVCDRCGGELIRRHDDEPETIRHRLNVYHKETKILTDFYQEKGNLLTVVGQEEIIDTWQEVKKVLGEIE